MSESGVDERIWVENNSQAYRVAYEVVERTTSILSPNFKQKVQDEMYRGKIIELYPIDDIVA